ncbi:hypothetical protein [Actinomadura sp. DC4]|uniref:hypothetical protein n=1 Tax=Actinomadura sp. DC4 TaxID=3055069 RepID=UPI0025B27A0C|nr:hypothetical protein [Actinomadura sp. DC4]MDN3359627.1 hypothetical protein [Actinomadura sp. DC4]
MTTIEDITIEGDGSQNAFGNTVNRDLIQTQLNFVRGRPSMVLSEGEIADRVAGYVPAVNHQEIVETLQSSHIVALAGPPGAGVATTAVAALRQLHPHMPIRLFSTGEDDVEEIGTTEARGYLVRAGDEEATRLRTCLETVVTSQAFLLVVGTEAEQRRFTDFLRVISVQPPPADAVYRRRLVHRGFGDTHWPGWPRAAELLKDASPGEARRLADLAMTAGRGGDAREVEQAYRGWAEELHGWFTAHPDLREETLMIAAATITPADETNVYGAALSLARQLKIVAAGGGLAWCPSGRLNELLDADSVDGRIVFRREGFAHSVLRHVWDEYPLARMDLLTWLSTLPTDEVVTLAPPLRIKIVETFADLAAEHEAAEKILYMGEQWAGAGAADLAYTTLARTCLHPLVGGRVRRRLYEWSRERHAAQTLKLTVARVCEVLGETHVSIALTRLKHLATYGDRQIQDEVFEVVRALARTQPGAVFAAMLEWCRTAGGIPGTPGLNRLRLGLRFLVADVMEDEPAEDLPRGLRDVVTVIGQLAMRDDELSRPVLLEALRTLAERHRPIVLGAALAWARSADRHEEMLPVATMSPLERMGTELFLALAVERDPENYALTLTGTDALDPEASLPAWRVALTAVADPVDRYGSEGGFADFEDAVRLWLDTAVGRPRLRKGVVSVFVQAAGDDPVRRLEMVDLIQAWAGVYAERRPVKESLLVRLLLPEWRRLLLVLLVRLRSTITGR